MQFLNNIKRTSDTWDQVQKSVTLPFTPHIPTFTFTQSTCSFDCGSLLGAYPLPAIPSSISAPKLHNKPMVASAMKEISIEKSHLRDMSHEIKLGISVETGTHNIIGGMPEEDSLSDVILICQADTTPRLCQLLGEFTRAPAPVAGSVASFLSGRLQRGPIA